MILIIRYGVMLLTCLIAASHSIASDCDAIDSCDSIACDGECHGSTVCDRNECDIKAILGGFAEKGIVFQGDLVQNYQGISSGGVRRHWKYGGLATYGALLDFGKLGLSQGTLLQISAQSQFGDSINRDTGSLLVASNTTAVQPTLDAQETGITDFLLTQFLSDRVAVFGGRYNTFGGDMNAFAHGRGKTQFMSLAFNANPVTLRTTPYVTYGVGLSIQNSDQMPVFTFAVLDPKDYATRTGLDELFSEGANISVESRFPVQLFNRPGHVLIAGIWSSRDVVLLNEIPRLPVDLPIPLPTGDSWAFYSNFDHYLQTFNTDGSQGWGVFGRWGFADKQTNPVQWFLSFGVGGNNPLSCRHQDTFGLGWSYARRSNALPGLLFADNEQSIEAFYNVPLRKNVFLTTDVQRVDGITRPFDEAWVIGMRLFITL